MLFGYSIIKLMHQEISGTIPNPQGRITTIVPVSLVKDSVHRDLLD